ncbi:MAG: peptide ABC transporter substrate-binding protein [Chloroflexota bacterium]|nr:peptide ABC transporter substrate-binding protein [Chloroflexota bacterium]MBI5702834.1 peptide ABC transporter substrate-binding protein [Chloroflexota bacterium]
MKQLRWQILVVVVTLGIVAILLYTQQSAPVTGTTILQQPEQGGVYTEALVGSLGRLNPLLDWNNIADRDVDRLLFSGLVRFDERGLPQADLAESWGVSQDGTIYNFTIRPNAVWHDGTPVTSDDVIFTIEMMKGAGSLYPQDIKDLWGRVTVTKLNDKNLKFTLPEPYVPFLDYLTFGVVPKHLLESVPPEQMASAEFNIAPVGSGPYQFDQLIVENGQIQGVVLNLAPNYYGTHPFIEQVVFRYYPSSAAAFEAYRQGDVSAVGRITTDVLNAALAEPNLSVYSSRLPQMGFVLFNLTNPETPFLQDADVRRALMLGLNRPAIINNVLQGQAFVADSPILPGSWAYFDGIERFEYDPEAAISLLKNEGYVIPAGGGTVRAKDGIPLAFTLVHPDDAVHTQIAQAIQTQWAQIGVAVQLQPQPYDQLAVTTLASRAFQAALVDLNLARTPDPDPYPFWHQAEAVGGQNYSGWDNRAASEYLEQARVTADYALRAKLYRNFQVIFAKELPALPLYIPVYSYGVDSQVKGVQIGPLYEPSDRLNTFTRWYLLTRRALDQGTPSP